MSVEFTGVTCQLLPMDSSMRQRLWSAKTLVVVTQAIIFNSSFIVVDRRVAHQQQSVGHSALPRCPLHADSLRSTLGPQFGEQYGLCREQSS